jgi:hypothetical protein
MTFSPIDIRDLPSITHAEIAGLNFIKSATPYVFRRHFRQGLRSHVMEILNRSDVELEQKGKTVDGVKKFPKASPRRMLRIFRTRLKTLDDALEEIARVKIVERYLAPDFMARSTECIVDYRGPDGLDLMLCGFQEYIAGEVFDPWTILDAADLLPSLYRTLDRRDDTRILPADRWTATVRENSARFIACIKRMITEEGHVPDLAGVGNLIVTVGGEMRLVDINNISPVVFDASVRLDEKGYPVGDKSIEALSLIEEKILDRPVDIGEPVYRHFLDPGRKRAVGAKEESFREAKSASYRSSDPIG